MRTSCDDGFVMPEPPPSSPEEYLECGRDLRDVRDCCDHMVMKASHLSQRISNLLNLEMTVLQPENIMRASSRISQQRPPRRRYQSASAVSSGSQSTSQCKIARLHLPEGRFCLSDIESSCPYEEEEYEETRHVDREYQDVGEETRLAAITQVRRSSIPCSAPIPINTNSPLRYNFDFTSTPVSQEGETLFAAAGPSLATTASCASSVTYMTDDSNLLMIGSRKSSRPQLPALHSQRTSNIYTSESNGSEDVPRAERSPYSVRGPVRQVSVAATRRLESELLEVHHSFAKRVEEMAADGLGEDIRGTALNVNMHTTYDDSKMSTTSVNFFSCFGLRHPASPTRVVWESLGAFLLFLDIIMIPMQTFDLPKSVVLATFSWTIFTYWSLDILVSFLVGYHKKDGSYTFNFKDIARRYARTWFFPDLLLISMDWFVLIASLVGDGRMSIEAEDGATHNMSILRAGKAVRVLRLFRLVRVVKMSKSSFMFVLMERLESERLYVMANFVKNVSIVLFLNHFTACFWYWVGSHRVQGYGCWVQVYGLEFRPWTWQYLTSLHWSLAQFANGEILIEPQNIPERCVCIVVLLLSVIVFSSFLAVVANTVSQVIQQSAAGRRDQFVLRLYMRQQKISTALKIRVYHYMNVITTGLNERVRQEDVKIFNLLSRPLQIELLTEVYGKHLVFHPFFSMLSRRQFAIMRGLCCNAIRQVLLSRGDILYSAGQEAHDMYLVIAGRLHYVQQGLEAPEDVKRNEWFCESVLWVQRWQTRGRMSSMTECELLMIEAGKFREVVTRHHTAGRIISEYATAFVNSMNQMFAHVDRPLSDYQMDVMISAELVSVLDSWNNDPAPPIEQSHTMMNRSLTGSKDRKRSQYKRRQRTGEVDQRIDRKHIDGSACLASLVVNESQ